MSATTSTSPLGPGNDVHEPINTLSDDKVRNKIGTRRTGRITTYLREVFLQQMGAQPRDEVARGMTLEGYRIIDDAVVKKEGPYASRDARIQAYADRFENLETGDILRFLLDIANASETNAPNVDQINEHGQKPWYVAYYNVDKDMRLQAYEEAMAAAAEVCSKEQLASILQGWAVLGDLHNNANLFSRENLLRKLNREHQHIEDSIENAIDNAFEAGMESQEIIQLVQSPTIEMVLTAHPTDSKSQEYIYARQALGILKRKIIAKEPVSLGDVFPEFARQGEFFDGDTVVINKSHIDGQPVTVKEFLTLAGIDLHEIDSSELTADYKFTHQREALAVAMRRHLETPITPEKKLDVVGTPDEPGEVYRNINYFKTAFETIPEIYSKVEEKLNEHDIAFDPFDIKLNYRFGSWAGGDRDGNPNVTWDVTAQTMFAHRTEVLAMYHQRIDAIQGEHGIIDGLERAQIALAEYEQDFLDAYESLSDDWPDWEATSAEIEEAMKNAYLQTQNQDVLGLLRQFQTFGLALAPIEIRQNAEVHELAMNAILEASGYMQANGYDSDYKDLDSHTQREILYAIKASGQAEQLMLEAEPALETRAAANPEDVGAVQALDLIKTLRVAANNHDLFKNYITAETQDVTDLLEVNFFMDAVGMGQGRTPRMFSVPLFEHPDLLAPENFTPIMEDIYRDPAYQEYMEQASRDLGMWDETRARPTQEIMLAHSDNRRRGGAPAAASLLYQASNVIDRVSEAEGVNAYLYHGAGLSDVMRGGMRSMTAYMDMFNEHEHLKITMQGGDNARF